MLSLTPDNKSTGKQYTTTSFHKIREDIQTIGNEYFKLQVGPWEHTWNPAQLLDIVTGLNCIIQMASTIIKSNSKECNQTGSSLTSTRGRLSGKTITTLFKPFRVQCHQRREYPAASTKKERSSVYFNCENWSKRRRRINSTNGQEQWGPKQK